MANVSSNRKLTPTYSSAMIHDRQEGGIPPNTPEAKAAVQRVKAQLASTRRKGNRDTVLTLPIMETKGGKA